MSYSKQDQQRGQDLANYYQNLLNKPPFLVPYDKDALQELIKRCKKGITPSQAFSTAMLAGPLSSKGWDTVQYEDFQFPYDHGPHYNIRNEWWYLASNFNVPGQDKPISILFVIIRRGTVPKYMYRVGQDGKNAQVVNAQVNVTIPSLDKHVKNSIFTAGDNSVMQGRPFMVSVPKDGGLLEPVFVFKSVNKQSVFPMNVQIKTNNGIDIFMTLDTPNSPNLFAEGNNGCAPCISGLGFRYYSWPNITATASINIKVDAKNIVKYDNLKGTAWMDHQWGARMMPLGYVQNYYLRAWDNVQKFFQTPRLNTRWNWFFFHLDNDTEITTALMPAPKPDDDRGPFELTNTTVIDSKYKQFDIEDTSGTVKYWKWIKSPMGVTYPSGWTLKFPRKDLHLELTPTVIDQFGSSGAGDEFFEGGVTIKGTHKDKDITGVGYAECVAYQSDTDVITNALTNLGYNTDEIHKIKDYFYPVKPNWGLFIISLAILITPIVLILILVVILILIINSNIKKENSNSNKR